MEACHREGRDEDGAQVLVNLEAPEDVRLSSTGLRLTNPAMTYEAFENLCTYLGESYATVKEADWALKFAIGDAIVQGEALFKAEAFQAFEKLGLSEETMKECARVSERVAPSVRRARVPWSQHRAVAAQPPDRQRELLRKVAEEHLSHHALREEIRNGAEPVAATKCRCCGQPL
jgi:hypothetical protein